MSYHRAALFAVAALFTAVMTSVASAGCCDRTIFAPTHCGGCGAAGATIIYAERLPPPRPVAVTVVTPAWRMGCGCERRFVYAVPPVKVVRVAPAAIYVVDQGPDYTGPGIVVPYRTWTLEPAYVAYPHYWHSWHSHAWYRHVAYRDHYALPPIWRHYLYTRHH